MVWYKISDVTEIMYFDEHNSNNWIDLAIIINVVIVLNLIISLTEFSSGKFTLLMG